jgi:hypothetical protein
VIIKLNNFRTKFCIYLDVHHVYGQFQLESGSTLSILPNHDTGKVLTSNSGGTATWQFIPTVVIPITGATNGLSVTDKKIKLGGQLTGNTTIDILTSDLNLCSSTNINRGISLNQTGNELKLSWGDASSACTASISVNDLNVSLSSVYSGGGCAAGLEITHVDNRICLSSTGSNKTYHDNRGFHYVCDYSGGADSRWLPDKGYVDSKLSGNTSASGERITKLICQVSHGFNVKDIIGWSGGTYNKAIANGLYDGEVVGIVSKCYNANCFDLTQSGYITGLTSLSVNALHIFLSDISAGLLTSIEPTGNTHISKSVLIANSSTSGWVLPYAGYVITSGASAGGTWGSITGVLSGQTDLQNALNVKLNISSFNDYTGTTLPANYYNKSQINTYTGTTLPANYYNKSQINTYTGTTLPANYYNKSQINTYTGTTAPATFVNKITFNAFTGATYSLSSPATKCVGGVCVNDVLTGKTAFQLLQQILAPELFPTSLVAPSISIAANPSGTFEIGCSISTLCITGTFNCGSISPQYCSSSSCRSGLANCYNFTGCQVVGSYACNTSSLTKCAVTYVICASQVWSVSVCYDCGAQPKGSAGTNYSTPLAAGITSSAGVTLTGIYPYYWGKLTCGSRPAVTSALVTGGTKVLAVSTGTVTISFGSGASEYTWLAIPQISTSKICWYVSGIDNGFMNRGCASDKYPDECQICVSSGQLCWSNVCYKVYMSGAVGAIISPMEFRNS